MTIAGVPKVLESAIVSILDSHSVLNWSIFGETNGNVSIKIRFGANGEGQGSSDIQHISYRRKSDKQLTRDKQRASKRKRVTSPEAENSLEIVRNSETSSIQNIDLDNLFPTDSVTPDLPPAKEIQHENFDQQNFENILDSTLSEAEANLNSTTRDPIPVPNFEIPETDSDNLFSKTDDAGPVNSTPEPEACVSNPGSSWKDQMRMELQQSDQAANHKIFVRQLKSRLLYPHK